MVGQGRPISCIAFRNHSVAHHQRARFGRLISCAVAVVLFSLALLRPAGAEETTARLRLAWGGGETKQLWTGRITIEGAQLSDLQPLGVELDAPVGLRIEGEQIVVAPYVRRGFDGCDVTVHADDAATVRVELRAGQSPHPTIVEAPLRQLIREQLRHPFDDSGSFFLAHRSPGDKLKVILDRDHLVFDPEETWTLRIEPDLKEELSREPVQLDIQLRAAGEKKVLWQAGLQVTSEEDGRLEFELECPAQEGAYRLTIFARTQEGFTTRFVPGRHAKELASRELEFVVVDPSAKLPVLTDAWKRVLAIDPANPSWWRRLPTWAQAARFSSKAAGAVGNIRPMVRAIEDGDIVELPPSPTVVDPYWQSYTLPVRTTGIPHIVELQYPLDLEQHLEISVIEPNAAGLVMKIGGGSALSNGGKLASSNEKMGTHRLMFWPRTRSPQLLIVNRHSKLPAQFGKIVLSRHDPNAEALPDTQPILTNGRVVAGYISQPSFTEIFGAEEMLDPKSGLSVQSWSAFLEGATRLAQYLRYSGQNTVLLSVAADGSALYPSKVINPSPRYDTGLLASSGQDPLRKDVLEMLLRIFDREGIHIVPTVRLTAPLPAIERLRQNHDEQLAGAVCIGPEGATWQRTHPDAEDLTPRYNLLNQRVQTELKELVAELPHRYGKHSAFAGVAVQVSGNGYGMLPGLAWGLDDSTISLFTQETGVSLTGQGPLRFQDRAQQLQGVQREPWTSWRTERLTQFYSQLSKHLQAERSDLQLYLTTEDLFAGATLQQQVRQSLATPIRLSQVLLDHGIDLARLNEVPGITALPPHRLATTDSLQDRAHDLRINSASDQGELISIDARTASLFHHTTSRNSLPSFDQQSPFGADRTLITLSSQAELAGTAKRRHLIKALAQGDVYAIVEGGEFLPLTHQAATSELLRTLQRLPGPETPMRTRSKQPVVLRIYRSENTTTLAMMNESPWPITVKLPLKTSELCGWKKLSKTKNEVAKSGRLTEESHEWPIELDPYDLQAWQFESATVRAGEIGFTLPEVVFDTLKQRIEEIESRTSHLDIERRYPQLQNPGFELEEAGVRLVGWQPRVGSVGKVEVETNEPRAGTRAIRLQSEDGIGVAVQSHLFPMPETGQLVVSAYVKGEQVSPEARLYITIEGSHGGQAYRRYTTLGSEGELEKEWTRYEFPINDIPIGSADQMRVMFHLTGDASVLIDDVEMHDLRFDKTRRGALVKRVYAAKTALDNGQIIDCLRLVDEYWSQYLVEYVPPIENEAVQIAKQPPSPKTELETEKEEPGIGDRVRGWIPRVWR